MPVLIAKSGACAGRRFEFERSIELGRGPSAGLSIDDPSISRRHVSFSLSERGCFIQDLGSQNGTAVNGFVIREPTKLRDRDELRIGGVRFDFLWEQDPTRRRATPVTLNDDGTTIVEALEATDPMASLVPAEEAGSAAISQRLRLISDVGVTIGQTLDEDDLFALLLEKLFEIFPRAERGFVMLYDAQAGEVTPKAASTRSVDSSQITMSRTLVWDVLRQRRGVLSIDAPSDERLQLNRSIRLLGIRSVLCVPMIARGEVYGVLALDSAATAGFEKDDLTLLLGIATQAALSLANARLHQQLVARQLLEKDLALAQRIQACFLPRRPPDLPGYEFRACYRSAQEIGGDYYDFLDLPGSQIGIALGDVSGKGISAALYMVRLSSEFRYRSAGEANPGKILRLVNSSLVRDSEEGMFATSLLLALDPSTGELRVANAGHAPPLLRRADGTILKLSIPRNIPLGVRESTFEQGEFRLQTGDTILVYTDGVSEATDPDDRLFGEERLREAVSDSEDSPQGILTGVLSAVERFLGGRRQNDDLTLVCFGPVSPLRPREAATTPLKAVRIGTRKDSRSR